MVRPTTKPRLHGLQANDVAHEIVAMIRAHIADLASTLSPGITWSECGVVDPLRSEFAATLLKLVRFAQTGDPPDWNSGSGAMNAIQTVCAALYSRAGEPGTFGTGALDDKLLDLEDELEGLALDPIGLVIVAAYARSRLAQRGSNVTARELAVLAGVDPDHVRLLARKGEFVLEGGRITRAHARRWLAGRGVRGFAETTAS